MPRSSPALQGIPRHRSGRARRRLPCPPPPQLQSAKRRRGQRQQGRHGGSAGRQATRAPGRALASQLPRGFALGDVFLTLKKLLLSALLLEAGFLGALLSIIWFERHEFPVSPEGRLSVYR